MRRQIRSGINLFFIEFIIVLFFFLLVGTVCIRVFFQSYQVTQQAEALSHAQTLAAGVAEALEGTDGSEDALLALYPDGSFSDSCLLLFLDRDFAVCAAKDAWFTLTADFSQSTERMKCADITVRNFGGRLVYELSVSFYRPLTRGEVLS